MAINDTRNPRPGAQVASKSSPFCDQSSSPLSNRASRLTSADHPINAPVPHLVSNDAEPIYTVEDAAHVTGVSVATIRRRIEAGLRGAYREGIGSRAPWRIPRQALVDAGLLAGRNTSSPHDTEIPDLERIIAAKDEVIETLRELVASQERSLSLQADLLARMERDLNPDLPGRTTVTELRKHA